MASIITIPNDAVLYEIDLDLSQNTDNNTVKAVQYDKNKRYIIANIWNNGIKYPITTTHTIEFCATKPSGFGIDNPAGIDSQGRIVYQITEQTTAEHGVFWAEFRITDAFGRVSPFLFKMAVEKSALSETTIISAPEVNILTQLIEDASKAISDMGDISSAESLRVSNENTRITNENTRKSNETTRVSNENTRKTQETSRVTAESGRVTAESTRVSQENTRKLQETSRLDAETLRNSSEDSRKTNEINRVNAENTRVSNENTRKSQETGRVTAESGRVAAEQTRSTNESSRTTNETTRQNQESARQSNESERQNYYNAYKVLETYSNTKAYIIGNKVTYQGGTYQCIANTTGNAPSFNVDNTWWKCIATKGDVGSQGIQGKSYVSKGNWGSNTDYVNNTTTIDTIFHDGNTYSCKLSHSSSTSNQPPNLTYWQLMAQKGADGNGTGDMLKNIYDPQNKATDFYNYVDNKTSILDTNKLDKTGDSSNTTVGFTQASTDSELITGSKVSVLFGLVKKKFADILVSLGNKIDKTSIINNDTTGGIDKPASAEVVKVHGQEIDELNNKLDVYTMTTSPALNTEAEIDNYYNNYSNSMPNGTYYRKNVFNNFLHSVMGGGGYYLEGFKSNNLYEWQTAKKYHSVGYIVFKRSKINGTWNGWERE